MTVPDGTASIDPQDAAARSGSWVGLVPVSAFKRLAPLIGQTDTDVEVDPTFEIDGNGLVRVSGGARVEAILEC